MLTAPGRTSVTRVALQLAGPAAVLLVAAGLGVAPPALVLLAVVGGLAALASTRAPHNVLALGLAAVAVVPFYTGQYLVGSIGITPMTALCLVLLPSALAAARSVRLHVLDIAVGVMVVVRGIAFLLNYEGGVGATAALLLGVALPYSVVRILSCRPDFPRAAALPLVVVAAALAVVGIREREGVPNPFFALAGGYQSEQWARPELRFGTARAEASFGHPIAFGMFLALALVLCLVLVLVTTSAAARLALTAAAALVLLALTATLSRGPLVVAVLAVATWLVLDGRRVDVLRLLPLGAVVVLALVLTPALATVQALVEQSSGDTRESRSAEYRLEVLEVVLDEEQFGLLGAESRQAESVGGSVALRTGLKSVDSEYAVVYLTSGALALGALLVVAAAMVRTSARRGLQPLERAWSLGMAASCVNLLTVALLTQHSELFWAGAAVVAGIEQRYRAAR